jgi:hypothetical protein
LDSGSEFVMRGSVPVKTRLYLCQPRPTVAIGVCPHLDVGFMCDPAFETV